MLLSRLSILGAVFLGLGFIPARSEPTNFVITFSQQGFVSPSLEKQGSQKTVVLISSSYERKYNGRRGKLSPEEKLAAAEDVIRRSRDFSESVFIRFEIGIERDLEKLIAEGEARTVFLTFKEIDRRRLEQALNLVESNFKLQEVQRIAVSSPAEEYAVVAPEPRQQDQFYDHMLLLQGAFGTDLFAENFEELINHIKETGLDNPAPSRIELDLDTGDIQIIGGNIKFRPKRDQYAFDAESFDQRIAQFVEESNLHEKSSWERVELFSSEELSTLLSSDETKAFFDHFEVSGRLQFRGVDYDLKTFLIVGIIDAFI